VTFVEEVEATLHEPSKPADGGDAPAEDDEPEDPMPADTEHVLWELLVGDSPPDDGENA